MSPSLKSGQIVILRSTEKVARGQIVVAKTDGRLVVKRLIDRVGNCYQLKGDHPLSSTYWVKAPDLVGKLWWAI